MEDQEVCLNLSKRNLKKLKRKQNKLKEMANKNEFQMLKEEKIKSELKERSLVDLISKDVLKETDYFFENGLRKVKPYHFDFIANAKGRWFGRSLVQVFSQEFQYYTEEKCKELIAKGSLRVEKKGSATSADHIICNGDIIINTIHRHELPVSSDNIAIVEETEEVLVVDKPPSMPIHPCGRYRHNSLLYILAKDHGHLNLRVAHRLDRLTSGLVIFCKTESKTKKLMETIRNREVKKIYLSKVDGVFPSETVVCEEAIEVLSHKLGIYRVKETGKKSKTTFWRISTDGKTSIVKCEPETGRTHQIRVHLQYLGHPISNDPTYNHGAWGPLRGKGADYGKDEQQLIEDLSQVHKSSMYINAENVHNTIPHTCNTTTTNTTSTYTTTTTTTYSGTTPTAPSTTSTTTTTSTIVSTNTDTSTTTTEAVSNNTINVITCNGDTSDSDAPPLKKIKVETCLANVDEESNNSTEANDNISSSQNESGDVIKTINNNVANKDNTSHGMNKGVNNDNNKNNEGINNTNNTNNGYDSDCAECHVVCRDPTTEEMFIYLHALSYQGPDWKYQTKPPLWSK